MAKLIAERLMRGEKISDGEMRMVIAGLMLSVDKITDVMVRVEGSLWTDARLREIIAEEIQAHCKGNAAKCAADTAGWWGRLLRGFLGR